MWDPRVDIRQNPRHLKNYLWAMTVMCPPDAPPGVAIAEFRSAKGTGSLVFAYILDFSTDLQKMKTKSIE